MAMTKAYIRAEIQRAAAENDGVSLGWRKFSSETRILESDWKRYWPRFSEAVREAGAVPNKLTTAYNDNDRLERYAALALELNRLPTAADVRFANRETSRLPEYGTYTKRFGAKSQWIARLAEYCRQQERFASVVRLCEAYSPRQEPDNDIDSADSPTGCVYLAKSGRYYKIGKSLDVGRRMGELKIQLPEKLSTVHYFMTDDPSGIEQYWHKRFAAKRQNGEWFDLNAEDIAAFKRRRKFM